MNYVELRPRYMPHGYLSLIQLVVGAYLTAQSSHNANKMLKLSVMKVYNSQKLLLCTVL